ncbi:hypothetical protein PVAND_003569 [Polypedilum vanderplanki]|uniref:Uncharacterized protein n=1 Tax=Polypedilum vanderplanki TaxID=319348 RepID=A0A9J6BUY7_POLVA|nr:hypothetical protein PVAND_003569 [Polypedilum vanderplanki]
MSNQCKNCDRDRDLNNNFVGYTNYMATSNNNNRSTSNSLNSNTSTNNNNNNSGNNNNSNTVMMQGQKITAKIMFGSLGAIKELREKEHAEKARSTQAGRRH